MTKLILLILLQSSASLAATKLYMVPSEVIAEGISGYSLASPSSPETGGWTLVTNTVNGPTSGVQLTWGAGGSAASWISPPLSTAVTISGSVTFHGYGYESAATGNAGFQAKVYKFSGGAESTLLIDSEKGTELSTTGAEETWSGTPGAGVSFAVGDRIVVKWFLNDAGGNMSSGKTVEFMTPGDSWISFSETISFSSEITAGLNLNNSCGSGSSCVASTAYGNTNGNLLLVTVSYAGSSASVSSITDNAGNTYSSSIAKTTLPGGSKSVEQWYVANALPNSSGLSVTANFSQSVSSSRVQVSEFTGVKSVAPLDKTSVSTGTSNAPNSGSQTISTAKQLIYGFCATEVENPAEGSGFVTYGSGDNNAYFGKTTLAIGSHSASCTMGTSDNWVAGMSTWKIEYNPTSSVGKSLAWVSGTSLTPTEPEGAAQDDVLFMWIVVDGANTSFVGPSGWNLIYYLPGTAADVWLYWIRRGGSAPSYGISWTNSVYAEASVFAWRDLTKVGNPYEDAASNTRTARDPSNPDTPSVTTLSPGAPVISFGMGWNGWASSATPPSGFNLLEGGSAGTDLSVAWTIKEAPGSVNPGAFAGSNSGSGEVAEITLALKPAASATRVRHRIRGSH